MQKMHILSFMLETIYNKFFALDNFTTVERKKMLWICKIAEFVSTVYKIVVIIAVSLFIIQAAFKENRTLVMEIWIPHKEVLKESPYFEIIYVLESMFFLASVYFCVIPLDRLFITMTGIIYIQFMLLRHELNKVSGKKSQRNHLLRNVITHHNTLLR